MNELKRSPFGDGSDLSAMASLARECAPSTVHVVDLPYRLCSWAFDDPENIALWRSPEGRLLAWAVMQTPFWILDIVCAPAAGPGLYQQVLDWADGRFRALIGTPFGLPSWYVNVFPAQVEQRRLLEQAGYRCQADLGEDSWSSVLLSRPGNLPVRQHQPPPGFTVRPLAGEPEVEAYVALHREVFGTRNMTVEWRRRTLRHPAYRPDLDLVVSAPDGRLAAFCVCWFDETSRQGQVEPLGCGQDYRRFALGRLALSQGLQRLLALGAREVLVETDLQRNTAFRLYESMGFSVQQQVLVYGKQVD